MGFHCYQFFKRKFRKQTKFRQKKKVKRPIPELKVGPENDTFHTFEINQTTQGLTLN